MLCPGVESSKACQALAPVLFLTSLYYTSLGKHLRSLVLTSILRLAESLHAEILRYGNRAGSNLLAQYIKPLSPVA